MARYIFFVLIFLALSPKSFSFDESAKWYTVHEKSEDSIKFLIKIIGKSDVGKKLLKNAQIKSFERGRTLLDVIKPGENSVTDTTLIRKFSSHNPLDIIYEANSVVYLNIHLSIRDALLDLSHELTHFVHRKPFNPYTMNFTLSEFIKDTIEGRGGEVDAFIMECNVLRELFPIDFRKEANCQSIVGADFQISKNKAIKNFYRVGKYYSKFNENLKQNGLDSEFSHLSEREVRFISSAYGLPYPVAAYKEYKTVVKKVCENDTARLQYLRKSRSIASTSAFSNLESFHEQRCSI